MFQTPRIGERAEVRAGLIEPPDGELVCHFSEALCERLIRAALHIEPAGRRADLAAVAELGSRTRLCGGFDIRVLENKHRSVAPELHGRLFYAVGAQMKQLLSNGS